jgi:hypothetical protein
MPSNELKTKKSSESADFGNDLNFDQNNGVLHESETAQRTSQIFALPPMPMPPMPTFMPSQISGTTKLIRKVYYIFFCADTLMF